MQTTASAPEQPIYNSPAPPSPNEIPNEEVEYVACPRRRGETTGAIVTYRRLDGTAQSDNHAPE